MKREEECEIVAPEISLAHIHRQVDAGQALALEDAAQQRLAARSGLGRVDVELVEERPGLGDPRDVPCVIARRALPNGGRKSLP